MLVCLMYHYVHSENDDKIFQNLKGITVDEFEKQIQYLLKEFTPIRNLDLVECFRNNKPLPKRSFYLTFDDGFKQHISNVLPILKKYNLEASFFIPTMPLVEKKIHFLEKQRVVQYSIYKNYYTFLEQLHINAKGIIDDKKLRLIVPSKTNLNNANNFLSQYSYYTKEERFYRKIRDEILNKDEIISIINILFKQYFNENEFIEKYYLNIDDVKNLNNNGMIVGSHSYSHPYLDKININIMEKEIKEGFDFLRQNIDKNINSFSYPYGTYNNNVIKYLQILKIDYAFTTKDIINNHLKQYEITRIDSSSFNKVFNND